MNKILMFIITFFILSININVLAECNYEEQARLNNLAGLVSSEYQVYEVVDEYYDEGFGETVQISSWYGKIFVYNVTDDLYLSVEGIGNLYSTDDDIVSIDTGITDSIKEYQIDIMAVNGSCDDKPIRSLKVTVPRFNPYSAYPQCLEYPDYYYCNKFVFLEEIVQDEFLTGINNYINRVENENKDDSTWLDKILDFFSNYYMSIIIVIILVLLTVIILKIKNKKDKTFNDKKEWNRK